MNLRIMPKLVAGTMLATAALGMTACGNRTNPKNEPSEDVFVKTETVDDFDTKIEKLKEKINNLSPEELSELIEPSIEEETLNLQEITYERNLKCEKRNSWDIDEYIEQLDDNSSGSLEWANKKLAKRNKFYNERGTYGASMIMQKLYDNNIKYATLGAARDYYLNRAAEFSGTSISEMQRLTEHYRYNPDLLVDYEKTPNARNYIHIPEVKEYMEFEYVHNQPNYVLSSEEESILIEEDEDLFNDGPASAKKCLDYLDYYLVKVIGATEEEFEEIFKDVYNFKESKQPLTVEGLAEVVAFKQFKVDSLMTRKYFKENDWWSPQIRTTFDNWCTKYRNSFYE